MVSAQDKSEIGLETAASDVGTYGAKAYGIGYLLVVLGTGMLILEIGASAGGVAGAVSFFFAWLEGGPALFLFLAWVASLIFAGQIIARSEDIQKETTELRAHFIPVTAFSMSILFLGLMGITLHIYTRGVSSEWNVALLFPSIISVASAIVLMIGFQVYSRELIASKIVGGIFVLISIFLLYFVSLTPWRKLWALIEASYPVVFPTLPPLPGPLLSESNIETVTLFLTAICGLIFAIPALREERRRSIGRVIVSFIVILFSSGLMLFNLSAISWMIAFTSMASPQDVYWPSSLWIILFGFLVLSVSGIILLISGCLSIASSLKKISGKKRKEVKHCANCKSEIPPDAQYCPKCGKEITR